MTLRTIETARRLRWARSPIPTATSVVLALVPILTLAFVSPATAQARFEFGPFLAFYRPIGTFEPTAAYSTALPNHPSDKAGPALGIRGRLWQPNRIGIEFQAAQAWSSVGQVFTPSVPSVPSGPTSVTVLTVAVQGLYQIASAGRSQFWLSAGGGLVRHGGDSYGRYGSPTSVAGTLGLGSDIRLKDRLKAVLGVTTYLYFLEVRYSGNTLQRGFQVDPLVQAGFTMR